MSAFYMVVFILEVKTEWISYSSSDWKNVEWQQGVIALLLYQVWMVVPLQKHRDRQFYRKRAGVISPDSFLTICWIK